MKSLVSYYSRTSTTKKLAESIAENIGADVEEIIPKVNYQGKLGYARAGKQALQEKIVEIEEPKHDPQEYDVVYLGTPVWASKSATPLISYIKQNEGKFTNVKFFATSAGGGGFNSTFLQLEKFTNAKPQATLGLTSKDVKKDLFSDKLSDFIRG